MNKKVYIIFLLFLFSIKPALGQEANELGKDQLSVDSLIEQLQGRSCRYQAVGYYIETDEDQYFPGCSYNAPLSSLGRRHDKYYCREDAAKCLGVLGKEAHKAVPVLIEKLKSEHDYDTGDGLIQIRSQIGRTLGLIQDPSAIKPLLEILQTNEMAPFFNSEPGIFNGTYHDAVIQALGMFGPQAKEAVPTIVPFLKYRSTEDRPQEFKIYENNVVCQAARALGKIGDPSIIPDLIEALDHPKCYYEAAAALGRFGKQAQGALPKLYQLKEKLPAQASYESNKVLEAIRKLE